MTSPDTPQTGSPQPGIPQPAAPDNLLKEVLQSENPATGAENAALAGSAQLAERVSDAVTGTTGVTRIEPTLKNAIVKLTEAQRVVTGISRTTSHDQADRYFAVDGVSVVIRDDHYADVSVDIVIDTTQPARTTAHHTRTNITHTIQQAGLTPGRTTVAILAVE